jgi:hypothetical protein
MAEEVGEVMTGITDETVYQATPLDPVLAERIHKYGLAKCVYAAAHDVDPWTVDETDGGYGDITALIAEDWNATTEPLALAVGLPDDSEYAEILARVSALQAAYGYLAEVVRKYGRYPLANDLMVAEYAIKHGSQVIERVAAGKCPGCGDRPPEDGYLTCWDCVIREENPRG